MSQIGMGTTVISRLPQKVQTPLLVDQLPTSMFPAHKLDEVSVALGPSKDRDETNDAASVVVREGRKLISLGEGGRIVILMRRSGHVE